MKNKGEGRGEGGESLQTTIQSEIYKGEGAERVSNCSKVLKTFWSGEWEGSGQNCPSKGSCVLHPYVSYVRLWAVIGLREAPSL